MLKIYLTFVFAIVLTSSPLLAQQLPQINYQGVARKADGSIISDQSIRLRLTIRDGGTNGAGTSIYSETRQRTTSKFGLFTVVIGSAGATAQTGAMATINWATGNKFLQVELDPLGGTNFIDMGTSQLQSVPYAIYANAAAPTGIAGGDLSGTYPNPTIKTLNGAAISITAPLTGQVLKWSGSAWTPANELASTAGPQGIQGVAGAAGGAGLTGAKGDIGLTGPIGLTGATGSKGDIGASGAPGTNGAAGLTTSVNGVTQVNGAITLTKTEIGLGNVSNTADADKPVSSAIQTALDLKASLAALAAKADQSAVDLKAPLASPTFTGTVSGVTAVMVGLGNVNNTSDAAKPISTAIQTALDLKASLAALAAKADQSAVDLKAPIASPTFTGTVSGVTAVMVGLGNVNNTSDAAKPISTAIQTALDLKASVAALAAKADQSAVDLKAPLASPTFTGTVSGVTATMVGLGNVNNTSDAAKPISTAIQTALDAKASVAALAAKADQSAVDLKAPIASPTFTGTVSGVTAAMVGLGNVNNTTDLLKPISTATQTALNAKSSNAEVALKAPLASPAFTGAPILPTGTIGVTQAVGNNTTALATTAFVNAATSVGGSFVDLTTAQTIAGVKTFSTDAKFNEITVGRGAGNSFYSTAVGYEALKVNTTGGTNTANGALSLRNNTTGSENTAIGVNALHINTIGSNNTGIGSAALYYTSGRGNTAIGKDAMYENTTGSNNTAIGYNTGVSAGSGTGSGNTILGANVTGLATTLTNNIILANGTGAIKAQNNGTDWTLTGGLTAGGITYPAINGTNGQVLTTNGSGVATWATAAGSGGSFVDLTTAQTIAGVKTFSADAVFNTITVGRGAGTNTDYNTAVGAGALRVNSSGYYNTAIGRDALYNNTGGLENTAIGLGALYGNSTGSRNTATGFAALYFNNGIRNTANGNYALYGNRSGNDNTATGMWALQSNRSGNNNTANGTSALFYNFHGSNNTANGFEVLYENTDAIGNTGTGYQALRQNVGGNFNTATGNTALYDNNSGSNNTALGSNTGRGLSSGSGNTILGANVGNVSISPNTALAAGLTNNIILANGTGAIKAQNDGTNWTLTGGLTAGGITYPSITGTNGQVLTSNGSGTASWAAAGGTSTTYTVGASATQGGYIFYVTPDGKHGLVAATQDQTGPGTFYNAQGVISNPANHNAVGKNFTDWRLPTNYELDLMYTVQNSIGGFIITYYWSSWEDLNNFAWFKDFGNGSYISRSKDNTGGRVRAVRAF